ncbi:SulP family inorganic anion transporter [Paenibacillus xerothermodurans]|uniref:SulP family inorganic anion transporter n=1 Tax=Paenibacillus xerothermodurans TaxID=1977292 RepID=A0A2W1N5W6_PAEXE|nr:SulP family inorganic anion transporter [Paenibacillus xerothermodurans]PZE19777.1 SulP family inorganic anion transporter [Paenibacillus xerothermodurans]
MFLQQLRRGFLGNVRNDVLSGVTVALALIPEAIAFSIMAGVDPMVGLYASFTIAVTISIVGGRPGMISAATGAMASLMGPIIVQYGVEYLFAATILTGILQWLLGVLKVGRFITFVPQSVIVGFVNALAIIIFMAQLPNFAGESWPMYAMVAGTLAIIYLLPLLTKAVPSALTAIIVITLISVFSGADVRTVGDMGNIQQALPLFHIPQIAWSFDTLLHLLPYSLALAVVGLTESLLTATIVDEMTETKSDKNREVRGQGIANVITGFFGGMAGCAMIGQTVINVKSGGRTRLSTLVAGLFLLFLILVLGDIVKRIPMAALVGVMFMVSIGTFDWGSLRTLGKIPRSDAVVMVLTVAIVVATSDLAIGVVSGVILSSLNFGWKMASLRCRTTMDTAGRKTYHVSGQLFFGTMTHFVELFDHNADPGHIVIDFSGSHVWDHSAITAISKVTQKYAGVGKTVDITGLNHESQRIIDQMGLSGTSAHQ